MSCDEHLLVRVSESWSVTIQLWCHFSLSSACSGIVRGRFVGIVLIVCSGGLVT